MWALFNYRAVQRRGEIAFLSHMTREEYDCDKERQRTVYFSMYSDGMGEGRRVYSRSESGDWDSITRDPRLWHFNFRGPDVERLVKGRERIYLDRFWNELSANPKAIDEATREHSAALYARPLAMHDAFEQFGAFTQDAIDNKALLANGGKLSIPVLAVGAEKSFNTAMADEMRFAAANVSVGIVPDSGHWVMEENPDATTKLVLDFLSK